MSFQNKLKDIIQKAACKPGDTDELWIALSAVVEVLVEDKDNSVKEEAGVNEEQPEDTLPIDHPV